MKVAIVGSRCYRKLSDVIRYVNQLPEDVTVVTGGARGVDQIAEHAARARELAVIVFLPDWNAHGNAATFVRNHHIAKEADRVVAFWDGKSTGTAHTIEQARKLGRPVQVIYENGLVHD